MNKLMVFYKIVQSKPSIIWVNNRFIEDRLSTDSFTEAYLKWKEHCSLSSNFKMIKIKDISVSINIGFTSKRNYQNDGIKFLNISNIEPFNFNLENVKYISKETHEDLKKSQLKSGDVLLTITGTVGDSVVVPSNFGEANISANIVALRLKKSFDSYYLSTFFNSTYGKLQTKGSSKSNVWSNLGVQQVREIEIPIPSPEIQKYIGDKVRKAEELREEAKTLQKEIDILLEVDMLLKEETDKVYNIYDSKINWTNEINIEDRIDPNFYQKKYISTIEKLGNNKVRLEKYVRITKTRYQTGNINKYIEISSINNSFGTIDEVEELRPEEIPTSAKYQVKEGDILVSLVRPTRKAISIVTKEYDNAICTGGFAVLQSKGKVPVEFLTAVLRTNFVGIQFERYCAGSTYPTINEDDVVKVFIPMYSENQINKITENYRRIIDNIYTSKKLIQEAKQDVEDLIEGNFDMSKVKANS